MAEDSRRRVQRNVSLQPEHEMAIVWIAEEDSHGNASRVVQNLIEAEMRQRIGRDWRVDIQNRQALETALVS